MFAGLWDSCRNVELGDIPHMFTNITTTPKMLLKSILSTMPGGGWAISEILTIKKGVSMKVSELSKEWPPASGGFGARGLFRKTF